MNKLDLQYQCPRCAAEERVITEPKHLQVPHCASCNLSMQVITMLSTHAGDTANENT